MDKHLKKALIYMFVALMIFIAGVFGIDKANQNLQKDISRQAAVIQAKQITK